MGGCSHPWRELRKEGSDVYEYPLVWRNYYNSNLKQFPGRGDTGSSPCLSLVIQSWIGYFTIINAIFSLHCPEELEKGVHDRVLMWEFSHVLEESSNNWAIGTRYFAMTVCAGCVTFKSPYGSDSSKFRLIFTIFKNDNVFPFELYLKCFFFPCMY